MTDQTDLDRAMTLAEMAPHPSVTFGALAGRESGFRGTRLHAPAVTYFEDTEAPAYLLTNSKRGVGVGTKRNTTTPSDDGGTIVVITGRRTLCLIGGETEDEVIEVPHETVAAASYHTGMFGHRLVLETPRTQYHCWVTPDADESLLEAATEFVRERTPEAPYEDESASEEPAFTYRGQPVTREQHPGLPDEPPDTEETANPDSAARDGAGQTDDGPSADLSASETETNGAEPDSEDQRITYRGQVVDRERFAELRTGLPVDGGDESEAKEDRNDDYPDVDDGGRSGRSSRSDGDPGTRARPDG